MSVILELVTLRLSKDYFGVGGKLLWKHTQPELLLEDSSTRIPEKIKSGFVSRAQPNSFSQADFFK
jgi:hypothetical protein